jgi:endonuclease YncB( thermonuclease family)
MLVFMFRLKRLSALALIVVGLSSAAAETLQGRVVGVTDGDTIRLLVDGRREYKVRLGEIDAPESGQPYGRASRKMLSDLVYGQTISARVTDVDRYGRAEPQRHQHQRRDGEAGRGLGLSSLPV